MIKLFIHIATMGEYQKITQELFHQISESGLLDACNEFNVCIVGDGDYILPYESDKIKVHRIGGIDEFEFPTLQLIEDTIMASDENIKVFYFNGLGVTDNSVFKQSWRAYLTYFDILNYKECVKALDNGYDVCGVDWRTDPVPHYSGNFWWANSEYLKTLPKIQTLNKPNSPVILLLRHNAEMYIGMNPNVKPRILHQSNISQYERHLFTYESTNYIGKIAYEDVIKSK